MHIHHFNSHFPYERHTPLGMQASIFGACAKPGYSGRVAAGRASSIKMGGDDGGGLLISPDGVAASRMIGVSASVIFPCTIKSRSLYLFWHRLTR